MRTFLLAILLVCSLALPVNAQEQVEQAKITVPVLIVPKDMNEAITADDLTTIELPAKRAASDTLTDMQAIIGQAPRHPLRANVPLRSIDLRKPYIVTKGSKINMVYQNGPMQLTATGRALDNGGMDDPVRAVNIGSNQTVEGRVSGTNTVRLDTKP